MVIADHAGFSKTLRTNGDCFMAHPDRQRDELQALFASDPAAFLRRYSAALTHHQGLRPRSAMMSLSDMIELIREAEASGQLGVSPDNATPLRLPDFWVREAKVAAC
jgi:hypothetical protein